jgi:ABC-type Fe3+ transport system substrate-binding protein
MHPTRGALLIPNTVAIVAGSSRPDEARRLLEFLLSEQVERMLFESPSRNIPWRLALDPEAAARFVPPEPVEIDWASASRIADEAVKSFLDATEGAGRRRAEPASPARESEEAVTP